MFSLTNEKNSLVFKRGVRTVSFTGINSRIFTILTLFLLMICPAYAQDSANSPDTTETSDRERAIEATRTRQDQRASIRGGTGLVFTRSAILLPRKHLNMSGYFNYSYYNKLQGGPDWADPRRDDQELNFVVNYGITHYLEVGSFINVFLQDEDSDADQLHMRTFAIGQSGLNLKWRMMDIDKNNMGIATTAYLLFPSPQGDSDLTSEDVGYGGELNVSLKLVVFRDWLEKFVIHGNLGYGHFDYFDTGMANRYQSVRNSGNIAAAAILYPGWFDPAWTTDDIEMEDIWFSTDHYTGSIALEYELRRGLRIGGELVGYRMIEREDDNLQLAPYVSYTLVELPFFKKMHKDIITLTLAGNFGINTKSSEISMPEYGIVTGITYHADLKL